MCDMKLKLVTKMLCILCSIMQTHLYWYDKHRRIQGKIFNRLIKLSKCFLQISSQFPGSHRLMWTYVYYLPGSPWLLYKNIVQMDFVHHQQIRGEWKWRRRFLQSRVVYLSSVKLLNMLRSHLYIAQYVNLHLHQSDLLKAC